MLRIEKKRVWVFVVRRGAGEHMGHGYTHTMAHIFFLVSFFQQQKKDAPAAVKLIRTKLFSNNSTVILEEAPMLLKKWSKNFHRIVKTDLFSIHAASIKRFHRRFGL